MQSSKGGQDAVVQLGPSILIVEPLKMLRAMLEQRLARDQDKETKAMLKLLDCFEYESALKDHFKEKMTMCQLLGLVAKYRGRDCEYFQSYVEIGFEQPSCDWCKWESEL